MDQGRTIGSDRLLPALAAIAVGLVLALPLEAGAAGESAGEHTPPRLDPSFSGPGIRLPTAGAAVRLAADDRPRGEAGDRPPAAEAEPAPLGEPVEHSGELSPPPPGTRDPAEEERARQRRQAVREASREATRIANRTSEAIERLILDGRDDNDNEFVLGTSISAGPSYSGASDFGYSISPAARLTWRGYSISTQSVARASARVEQNSGGDRTGITGPLTFRNRFAYGFGVSLNRGRSVTDEGAALGLKSLPTTVYGRIRLRYSIDEQTTLSATLIGDLLNRQRNLELPIGISRRYVLGERMVLAFDAAINVVSRRSMDNDYGIGLQQSAASGLPVYQPSGGLREVAVSAVLVHEPDNHWIWMTRFSLVRLVGHAHASPLVKSSLQPYLMFGFAYRFTWD